MRSNQTRFIDLFAGIGGMRIGFEAAGAKCVFSSEIDKHAQDTYEGNFGERPHGDIKLIEAADIPSHDVLLAGFPCQPFSIAGVSKLNSMKKQAISEALDIASEANISEAISERASTLKNDMHSIGAIELNTEFQEIMNETMPLLDGEERARLEYFIEEANKRENGFLNETKGTLFFDICRILEHHRPPAFLLENVKGLTWHNGGRTIETIMNSLQGLGYTVEWKIVNSRAFVPQRRERIFLVGFNDGAEFEFPDLPQDGPVLGDILEHSVDPKYTLNDHLWNYHQERKRMQREKGNGFGYRIFGPGDTTGTLPARYYKDGADILLEQAGENPRRLTPRECARLMGFDDKFKLNNSEVQSYKQLGNAVVPPLVAAIAKEMASLLSLRQAV